MQMQIAICDDSAEDRAHYTQLIKLMLSKMKLDASIKEFSSAEQLMFSFAENTTPPDIFILDIFMPGVTGISLGRELRAKGYAGLIIYLTRSEEHMIEAFDIGATNYVIKDDPYNTQRLEKVFKKAANEVKKRKRKYVLLNGISEHRNIDIEDISYFEVNKYICIVHYNNETFEFVSTLTKIENMFASQGFVRIHRSYLVRAKAVATYNYKSVVMDNGDELPIGRNRYAHLVKMVVQSTDYHLSSSNS